MGMIYYSIFLFLILFHLLATMSPLLAVPEFKWHGMGAAVGGLTHFGQASEDPRRLALLWDYNLDQNGAFVRDLRGLQKMANTQYRTDSQWIQAGAYIRHDWFPIYAVVIRGLSIGLSARIPE